MTTTLLGAIVSYLLPFAGRIFGLFEKREQHKQNLENDRLDHEREMELGRVQAEIAKADNRARVETAAIETAGEGRSEANKSYRAESRTDMSTWVHNVRGMARPVITGGVAFTLCRKELAGEPISPEFAGIAVAVILFWFGGRDVLHYAGKAGRAAGMPASWNWLRGVAGKK